MASTIALVKSGAYYDSVVLMQLQRALSEMPGVLDAGVVMGTGANKELLTQSDLLVPEAGDAGADDLVIVVRASDERAATHAISQVDSLLSRRRVRAEQEYLPKSLQSAAQMLPDAQWVLVSVPGRYAAAVGRDALGLNRHVFLYSDNVTVEDEVALKKLASETGLLVMGPDCGTAIINGVGLGFANRVRRGPIGMVAASGTGLQQVSARIHQLGSGITHALGTGGRDLSERVGAITAHQSLDFLGRDPETAVILLVSKPPARQVAAHLLNAARSLDKPVVVDFVGYSSAVRKLDNVVLVSTFDEAARAAVELAEQVGGGGSKAGDQAGALSVPRFAPGQRFLRGLYSGGTLAYEGLLLLQGYVPHVYSNVPLEAQCRLQNPLKSREHTIVDLGEDEFTVGRLHPMMDNDLRIRRLRQEADDPEVAVVVLDVVLGYGAHPDPAGELAGAIQDVKARAEDAGRYLEVVALVVGTDEDPQDMPSQIHKLREAGAHVEIGSGQAIQYAGRLLRSLEPAPEIARAAPVRSAGFRGPMAAINVGLETFADSLKAQGAAVVHVDWRPPAGGNERLMAILQRMQGR